MEHPCCEWSWDVDADHGISSVKVSGLVTAIDIAAVQNDLAAHPRFNLAFGVIVDLSGASDVVLTWRETQAIVRRSPVSLYAPRAIVANTIVVAAMAHAYRVIHDEMSGADVVRICRSLHEAREWITGGVSRV